MSFRLNWTAADLNETKNIAEFIFNANLFYEKIDCRRLCSLYYCTGNRSAIGDFAANGYEHHSPGKYSLRAALITEFAVTFMFLIIILGSTYPATPAGFAGIAIGLALTLIHLISIPITNTSVNLACSISQAIFVGGPWSNCGFFCRHPDNSSVFGRIIYKAISDKTP